MIVGRMYYAFHFGVIFMILSKASSSSVSNSEHGMESSSDIRLSSVRERKWSKMHLIPENINNIESLHRTTLSEDIKVCVYRTIPTLNILFPYFSGFGCYQYSQEYVFNTKLKAKTCTYIHQGKYTWYYCFQANGKYLPFDYRNDEAKAIISATFTENKHFEKWMKCSKAGNECCDQRMNNITSFPDANLCPAVWDGWYCWDQTPSGTVAQGVCPDYIYSADAPQCNYFSSKECFKTHLWNDTTNYATCSVTSALNSRHLFHLGMLGLSIIVSFPAVIIFISYRKLRITRVILHKNLLMVIILRGVFIILVKQLIIIDALKSPQWFKSAMGQNSAWCKTLSFFEKLFSNFVFGFMLMEGIYLHRRIANAFKNEPKMLYFYIVISVLSAAPALAWAFLTWQMYDVDCWTTSPKGNNFTWINDSIRLAMLLVNTILLIDVIRVLCTKLKRVNTSSSNQMRRTTKATLFLMPIFGVQFWLTAARPNTVSCDLEQTYYFFSYAMDGLLGLIVATLYCYLNKDVQQMLLNTFHELTGKSKFFRRDTIWSERRTTLTTTAEEAHTITDCHHSRRLSAHAPKQTLNHRAPTFKGNTELKPKMYLLKGSEEPHSLQAVAEVVHPVECTVNRPAAADNLLLPGDGEAVCTKLPSSVQ